MVTIGLTNTAKAIGGLTGSLMGNFKREADRAASSVARDTLRAESENELAMLDLSFRKGLVSLEEYQAKKKEMRQKESKLAIEELEQQRQDEIDENKIAMGEMAAANPFAAFDGSLDVFRDNEAKINSKFDSLKKNVTDVTEAAEDLNDELERIATNAQARVLDSQYKNIEAALSGTTEEIIKAQTQLDLDSIDEQIDNLDKSDPNHDKRKRNLELEKKKIRSQSSDDLYLSRADISLMEAENQANIMQREGDSLGAGIKRLTGQRDRDISDIDVEMVDLDRSSKQYKALNEKRKNIKADTDREIEILQRNHRRKIEDIEQQSNDILAASTYSLLDDARESFNKETTQARRELQDALIDIGNDPIARMAAFQAFSDKIDSAYNSKRERELEDQFRSRNLDSQTALLTAQAKGKPIEAMKIEYLSAIDQINQEEKKLLETQATTEAERLSLTKNFNAQRLKLERDFQEQIGDAAIENLEQVKEIRELIFQQDTNDFEDIVNKNQRMLSKIDIDIRRKQLELDNLLSSFDQQKLNADDSDMKASFLNLQSGLDLEGMEREALKLANVNIASTDNDAAALKTRTEAMAEYVNFLRKEAEIQESMGDISESEKITKLQQAAALEAAYSKSSLSQMNSRYDSEIQTMRDQGQTEEQIDLVRGKRMKEEQELRELYSDNLERYKDLAIEGIEAREERDTESTRKEIENLELRSRAFENNIETQQIKIDELAVSYEEDLERVDNEITNIDLAHKNWNITIDQVRNNFSGTVESMISEYTRLKNNIGNLDFNVEGSSSTGSTTTIGGSTTTNPSLGSGRSSAYGGTYKIDGGDGYFYESSSAMYAAQGLAEGGLIPDKMSNRFDNAGLFKLDGGEGVFKRDYMKVMMNNHSMIPAILKSVNSGPSRVFSGSIAIHANVRNNSDVDNLVGKIKEVVNECEESKARKWAYRGR